MPRKKNIQKAALRLGGKVTTEDGTEFNSARDKVATRAKAAVKPKKAKPTPAPEPSPPPAPTQVIVDQVEVAEAIDKASTGMTKALTELKAQVANIQLNSPQPPIEWVFDIVRDDYGNIKQIKAKAGDNVPTIN